MKNQKKYQNKQAVFIVLDPERGTYYPRGVVMPGSIQKRESEYKYIVDVEEGAYIMTEERIFLLQEEAVECLASLNMQGSRT